MSALASSGASGVASCPCSCSSVSMCDPTNPVAPVSATFMVGSLLSQCSEGMRSAAAYGSAAASWVSGSPWPKHATVASRLASRRSEAAAWGPVDVEYAADDRAVRAAGDGVAGEQDLVAGQGEPEAARC